MNIFGRDTLKMFETYSRKTAGPGAASDRFNFECVIPNIIFSQCYIRKNKHFKRGDNLQLIFFQVNYRRLLKK